MATTSSKATFLQRLEQSRLLDNEQLARAAAAAAEADKPQAIARSLVREGLLSEWQAAQLLQGRTQFHLGKYKLIRVLGEGGMGTVFLAEHVTMNRRVAVKSVSSRLNRNPEALKQFLDEARTIAALDHPNIVHAYSVDEVDGRYFLVMEYVAGKDLATIVEEEGPLSFVTAVDLLCQAAEGLAYAHERGVIHCDVKPSNLLVTENGTVKILDLGMARFAEGESNGKRSSAGVLGTVDYMAPELALGRDDIDGRVDIYSLGCTLFFALTGKPPFPDGTLAERILKHQSAPRPSVREHRPETPADLDEYCRRMMAITPDERPASAAQVVDFLAEWEPPPVRLVRATPLEDNASKPEALENADDHDASDFASTDTGRSLRSRLVVVSVTVGFIVLLTVGLVAYVAATNRPSSAPAPQATTRSEKEVDDFERQVMDIVSQWSLDDEGGQPRNAAGSDSKTSPTNDQSTSDAEDTPEKPSASKPAPPEDNTPESEPPKPEETGTDTSPAPAQNEDGSPPSADDPAGESASEPPHEPENATSSKPSGEKPAPSPPQPPPKPKNPFEGLPAAIELAVPSPGDAERGDTPVVLARFTIPQSADLALNLCGGAAAIKGAREFSLEGAASDQWRILIRPTGPTGGDVVDVGRLEYASHALTLHWSPEVSPSDATYFANCGLRLQCTEWSHTLQLRKPVPGPPISLDLRRPISAGTIPLKTAPDASALQIVFFPPKTVKGLTLDPAGPHSLQDPTTILIGYQDRHGNVSPGISMRLTMSFRGSSLTFRRQLLDPPPTMLSRIDPSTLRPSLATMKRRLENELKNARGEEKAHLDHNLVMLERQEWLLDLIEQPAEEFVLHYRIVLSADDTDIVLVDSRLPAQQSSAASPPN
ncbi:hypothetical protein JCM19992_18070 [Thermostilla marina]